MEENRKLEVETALGTLVAIRTGDFCYPGIVIELHNKDGFTSLAVIEVNQCDSDKPVLQMHRWEEDKQEDPVETVRFDEQRVKSMTAWNMFD